MFDIQFLTSKKMKITDVKTHTFQEWRLIQRGIRPFMVLVC